MRISTATLLSSNPTYYLVGMMVTLMFIAYSRHGTTDAVVTVTVTPVAPAAINHDIQKEELLWSQGVLSQLHWWLDCDDLLDEQQQQSLHTGDDMHNTSTWKFLQDVYRDVVHEEMSSLPPAHSKKEFLKGYQVPIQVKKTIHPHDEDGERSTHKLGVFATRAIRKGTLVWKSTNTAQFASGADFRAFVKRIGVPHPSLACQVLDWAYPRFHKDEAPLVCVDLDHGSLTNVCHAGEDDCNMAVQGDHLEDSGCELEFHATRDIKAGEELKIDHDFSSHEEAFVPLGLAHELPNHLDEFDYGSDEIGDDHHDDEPEF